MRVHVTLTVWVWCASSIQPSGAHTVRGMHTPIDALVHGTDALAQAVRQHWNGASRRVHRTRACGGLIKHRRAWLQPVTHIRDVDAHLDSGGTNVIHPTKKHRVDNAQHSYNSLEQEQREACKRLQQ